MSFYLMKKVPLRFALTIDSVLMIRISFDVDGIAMILDFESPHPVYVEFSFGRLPPLPLGEGRVRAFHNFIFRSIFSPFKGNDSLMALISLQDVSLGFGGPRLFDGINLQIEQGEWVGLLGRNGMGKSTLLKLVNGDIFPQSGSVSRQQNLRMAYLPQEVPAGITGKVFDIVASGLDSPPTHNEHHWQGQLQ